MSEYLGINLVETDGRATPSIQGAPTSVAGFIIRSERGVVGAVRQVTSYAEFRQAFGDVIDGAYGAHAIRGFFDNGGSIACVTRVAGGGAKASSKELNGEGAKVLTVKAGYRGKEDPGTWGNRLRVQITHSTDNKTFTLKVRYADSDTDLEKWEGLAIGGTDRKDPARINDPVSGSKYVTITVEAGANKNPDETKVDNKAGFVDLGDGVDDNLADAKALATAVQVPLTKLLFDSFPTPIQLLCCPEIAADDKDDAGKGFVNAALTYCETRGDCMFVGHTPEDTDAANSLNLGKALQADKHYGALYFPWIRVTDPRPGRSALWVPPVGHILGVYARTERERGIWKAPAGNAARLNNALDVKFTINDQTHTDLVKNGSVNAVRFITGQGIIIDSSRTLSTNPLWTYVNVRLLFNYVKSSLKLGLRWVVQEPNDPTLWNKVKFNSVTPFLMGLWRRGAFGPGPAEKVFTVKVDADNNTAEDIQQGRFKVEVYFYPSRPAETIIIQVGQQDGGSAASEK